VEPRLARAYFRFYAELNDHLGPGQRYETLEKPFLVAGTVKDMIQSFGVPHTEVELILANGHSVDFAYTPHDGEWISVYPMFESVDISSQLRVRPEPLRDPKFVLDVHLGKLAAYLRMIGFDTLYRSSFADPELVQTASREHRILLTRDRGLLMHNSVTHGYWLRETDSRRQTAEVVRHFDLFNLFRPFTRCMACNGALQPVLKEHVRHLLTTRTTDMHDDFRQCCECGRVYWKGSHYVRMRSWIEELKG
jgi:uncharacterized protein with PIN domain